MAIIEIKIPSVGESITEVVIASWLKGDGDIVEVDESLAEIESDKATVELPAEVAGTLKILVEEGETVAVGAVVCSIDTDGAGAAASAPAAAPAEAAPEAPAPAAAPAASGGGHAQGHPSPAAGKDLSGLGVNL